MLVTPELHFSTESLIEHSKQKVQELTVQELTVQELTDSSPLSISAYLVGLYLLLLCCFFLLLLL